MVTTSSCSVCTMCACMRPSAPMCVCVCVCVCLCVCVFCVCVCVCEGVHCRFLFVVCVYLLKSSSVFKLYLIVICALATPVHFHCWHCNRYVLCHASLLIFMYISVHASLSIFMYLFMQVCLFSCVCSCKFVYFHVSVLCVFVSVSSPHPCWTLSAIYCNCSGLFTVGVSIHSINNNNKRTKRKGGGGGNHT